MACVKAASSPPSYRISTAASGEALAEGIGQELGDGRPPATAGPSLQGGQFSRRHIDANGAFIQGSSPSHEWTLTVGNRWALSRVDLFRPSAQAWSIGPILRVRPQCWGAGLGAAYEKNNGSAYRLQGSIDRADETLVGADCGRETALDLEVVAQTLGVSRHALLPRERWVSQCMMVSARGPVPGLPSLTFRSALFSDTCSAYCFFAPTSTPGKKAVSKSCSRGSVLYVEPKNLFMASTGDTWSLRYHDYGELGCYFVTYGGFLGGIQVHRRERKVQAQNRGGGQVRVNKISSRENGTNFYYSSPMGMHGSWFKSTSDLVVLTEKFQDSPLARLALRASMQPDMQPITITQHGGKFDPVAKKTTISAPHHRDSTVEDDSNAAIKNRQSTLLSILPRFFILPYDGCFCPIRLEKKDTSEATDEVSKNGYAVEWESSCVIDIPWWCRPWWRRENHSVKATASWTARPYPNIHSEPPQGYTGLRIECSSKKGVYETYQTLNATLDDVESLFNIALTRAAPSPCRLPAERRVKAILDCGPEDIKRLPQAIAALDDKKVARYTGSLQLNIATIRHFGEYIAACANHKERAAAVYAYVRTHGMASLAFIADILQLRPESVSVSCDAGAYGHALSNAEKLAGKYHRPISVQDAGQPLLARLTEVCAGMRAIIECSHYIQHDHFFQRTTKEYTTIKFDLRRAWIKLRKCLDHSQFSAEERGVLRRSLLKLTWPPDRELKHTAATFISEEDIDDLMHDATHEVCEQTRLARAKFLLTLAAKLKSNITLSAKQRRARLKRIDKHLEALMPGLAPFQLDFSATIYSLLDGETCAPQPRLSDALWNIWQLVLRFFSPSAWQKPILFWPSGTPGRSRLSF